MSPNPLKRPCSARTRPSRVPSATAACGGLGVAIDCQQASGVPQARQDRAAVAATAEGAIDVDPALPNPEVRHDLIEQHRGVELAGAGTDHR